MRFNFNGIISLWPQQFIKIEKKKLLRKNRLTGEIFWSAAVSLCPAVPAGTSANPLTCNIWAVFKKSVKCSCPICTSPLYINL